MKLATLHKWKLIVIQADVVLNKGTIWPTAMAYALFSNLETLPFDARPAVYVVNHEPLVGLRYWRQSFVSDRRAWESLPTVESEAERLEAGLSQLPVEAVVVHAFAHRAASRQWSPTPPRYAGQACFGRGITLLGGMYVSYCMSLAGVHKASAVACIGDAEFLSSIKRPSTLPHRITPEAISLPIEA